MWSRQRHRRGRRRPGLRHGPYQLGGLPASRGPGYDTTYNGGNTDAFVVKLDAAGTGLLYATFLGGSDSDEGNGIAVDGAGQAYVTGGTASADFPASLGPGYDTSFNGGSATPSSSSWTRPAPPCATPPSSAAATETAATSIAVDSAGQAYVTGSTSSADFPASLGPGYDTSFNGRAAATPSSSSWTRPAPPCATPPSSAAAPVTRGYGIAVDGAGQAYVTGSTSSADFPASLGPGYDTSFNGGGDAFVVKLDAAGAALRYATFLGGSDGDDGCGIAVDGAGQAYVTGRTASADFPASLGPGYDTSSQRRRRRLRRQAGRGRRRPALRHLPRRQRLVTTATASPWTAPARPTSRAVPSRRTSRPASAPATTPAHNGGEYDAFVVKLDAAGAALRYATFLGGSSADYGYGIAVDGAGEAYVTGKTRSEDFPASLGPGYDTSHNGGDGRLRRQAGRGRHCPAGLAAADYAVIGWQEVQT